MPAADPRGPSELRRQQPAVACRRSDLGNVNDLVDADRRINIADPVLGSGRPVGRRQRQRRRAGQRLGRPGRPRPGARRRHALQAAVRVPDHRPRQPAERQRARAGRSYQPGDLGLCVDPTTGRQLLPVRIWRAPIWPAIAYSTNICPRPRLRPGGDQPAAGVSDSVATSGTAVEGNRSRTPTPTRNEPGIDAPIDSYATLLVGREKVDRHRASPASTVIDAKIMTGRSQRVTPGIELPVRRRTPSTSDRRHCRCPIWPRS